MTADPKFPDSNGFCELARQSFKSANLSLILKAHGSVAELSGRDLAKLIRPADILLRQHADAMVIAAALLVPLCRDGAIQPGELRALFGETVAGLVQAVISEEITRIYGENSPEKRLRSLLESISQDVRLVILHLGLRLSELEVLAVQGNGERRGIAQESLNLYVPLADRMGMGVLRSALEDMCFRILEPAIYAEMVQGLEPIQAEDEACLELLTEGIQHLLERNGVTAIVQGRTKGLYSLYRKMCCRNRPLHEIMDKIGLRVIVSKVEECYISLGLLHTHFRPVPGTFDDYIGLPKENGYRSLHTCIYPVPDISYKPVEIQIRTEGMHQEAWFGIAAHWRYKLAEEAVQAHQGQLRWLRSLLAQHAETVDHAEFVELLHRQVFSDNLLVFSKGGQLIRLSEGAMVRDFERVVGTGEEDYVVQVNRRICPPDHSLRDGDTVELVKRGMIYPSGGTHD